MIIELLVVVVLESLLAAVVAVVVVVNGGGGGGGGDNDGDGDCDVWRFWRKSIMNRINTAKIIRLIMRPNECIGDAIVFTNELINSISHNNEYVMDRQ